MIVEIRSNPCKFYVFMKECSKNGQNESKTQLILEKNTVVPASNYRQPANGLCRIAVSFSISMEINDSFIFLKTPSPEKFRN